MTGGDYKAFESNVKCWISP